MATHNQLTVVAIYGHNDGAGALPSLSRSLAELPGSRGLLLSVSRPEGLPGNVRWRQVDRLSYQQYSLFCMHALQNFIETDFCLVVQEDGWVLDGRNWQDEFYEYDYIGAPCHAARVGERYYSNFTWIDLPNPIIVQNGGFSLRSRKFLTTPSGNGVMYLFYKVQPFCNEDVQLTCLLRPRLEELGIRYAPVELAKRFSVEYMGPRIHGDIDFGKLLGHHAPTRKLTGEHHVSCRQSLAQAKETYRELEFLDYLQRTGYTVEYVEAAP